MGGRASEKRDVEEVADDKPHELAEKERGEAPTERGRGVSPVDFAHDEEERNQNDDEREKTRHGDGLTGHADVAEDLHEKEAAHEQKHREPIGAAKRACVAALDEGDAARDNGEHSAFWAGRVLQGGLGPLASKELQSSKAEQDEEHKRNGKRRRRVHSRVGSVRLHDARGQAEEQRSQKKAPREAVLLRRTRLNRRIFRFGRRGADSLHREQKREGQKRQDVDKELSFRGKGLRAQEKADSGAERRPDKGAGHGLLDFETSERTAPGGEYDAARSAHKQAFEGKKRSIVGAEQLLGERARHHEQRADDDDGGRSQARAGRIRRKSASDERADHEQQGRQELSALQFEIPKGERAVRSHIEKRDDAGLEGCEAQNGKTSAPCVA